MGHCRSTLELLLTNSHSGIGDGAIGWLDGRLDGKHQFNLLHISRFSRKRWEKRGCCEGRGVIFQQALVNMTQHSTAGWKMIYWLTGTWYRAQLAFASDIHHRGEVRGELIVNYQVSGEQWEGQCWGWIQLGRGEHTTKSHKVLCDLFCLWKEQTLYHWLKLYKKKKTQSRVAFGVRGGKECQK